VAAYPEEARVLMAAFAAAGLVIAWIEFFWRTGPVSKDQLNPIEHY
jgi:hypothetical protein